MVLRATRHVELLEGNEKNSRFYESSLHLAITIRTAFRPKGCGDGHRVAFGSDPVELFLESSMQRFYGEQVRQKITPVRNPGLTMACLCSDFW